MAWGSYRYRVSVSRVMTDRTCFGLKSGMKLFQSVELQNPPMVAPLKTVAWKPR